MFSFKSLVLTAGAFTLATTANAAVLTWNGSVDSEFSTDANWTGTATGGSIDTMDLQDTYVVADGDTIVHNGFLQFRDGGTLDMTGGSITGGPDFGGIGVLELVDSLGNLNISGGTISGFYFIAEVNANIGGDAQITLLGGGNPINETTVNLTSNDASIHFTSETVGAFTAEHLSKFTVNGAPAVIGTNLSVVSDGASGSIVNAIPEPASIAILGLGGMFSLARRKK